VRADARSGLMGPRRQLMRVVWGPPRSVGIADLCRGSALVPQRRAELAQAAHSRSSSMGALKDCGPDRRIRVNPLGYSGLQVSTGIFCHSEWSFR
jgi:hypothetical protein